jgi:hypothetical protein
MIDDTSRINQEMTEGLALLGHSSYYGWLCSREICPLANTYIAKLQATSKAR